MKSFITTVIAAATLIAAAPASALTYQWAKELAGDGGNVYHLEVGSTGEVYTTGNFWGTSDFDPGAGAVNLTSASSNSPDIFIAKHDANGNYLWAKRIGSTGYDNATGLGVDSSNNLIIGGQQYR
jgi:hypothetical protein